MTTLSLPLKIGLGAALMLAGVLAGVGAFAANLLPGDGSTATSADKRRPPKFKIRGNLRHPLVPGASQPLNLRLTNRYRFSLKVKRLTVRVRIDRAHAAAGCRASRDFRVTPLARRDYPIRLRPRRTRTLRALRVRRLPRVAMRNLSTNQDVCKGARLKLRYTGRARRWPRGHGR